LPAAHRIVGGWPDEVLQELLAGGAPIVVLSHDPKIDVPALACALRSPSRYVGLLGSRASQAHRRKQLSGLGFDGHDLARIHGPAGLDIGGESVAETALSIIAEVVASANDRGGGLLSEAETPIHAAKGESVPVRNY
jgi:xanthine dehydrogenase accessory factor